MKLLHAATAANRISDSAVLMGGALCGILGFTLVLPLALSGPYPTLKQGDWGIQPASSRQASIQPASTRPASTQPALFEVASVRSAPERFDQPSVLEATSLVEAKPSMERPPFAE